MRLILEPGGRMTLTSISISALISTFREFYCECSVTKPDIYPIGKHHILIFLVVNTINHMSLVLKYHLT